MRVVKHTQLKNSTEGVKMAEETSTVQRTKHYRLAQSPMGTVKVDRISSVEGVFVRDNNRVDIVDVEVPKITITGNGTLRFQATQRPINGAHTKLLREFELEKAFLQSIVSLMFLES